ncbi:MAG: HNH endonuclease [Drouetiella hepatica Uher 2000/2452]|jgi:hypothetical protein|uniref:HNH endonuclease n=1 Tax=Drouetiella hepatica Uher 2000/2452 TaxID=904376 RepID=A0A951QGR7_9CYAN|nr:HNH endonuclease [Drouetiella hepatica Uher 2000/2452]
MTTIPPSLRRSVIQRADDRCEYRGISQVGQVATFHIDHIIPVVAGGETTSDNLALACVSCSLRKGARQKLEDLETGERVIIFNPRQQTWKKHFRWDGVTVVGLTATGRATVAALDLNRAAMLAIRAEEELLGRHPPL